jgi:hypothetical protein
MDDAQIEGDVNVVDDVPDDDDEDEPPIETARTRTTCCKALTGAPCAALAAMSCDG